MPFGVGVKVSLSSVERRGKGNARKSSLRRIQIPIEMRARKHRGSKQSWLELRAAIFGALLSL